MGKDRKVDQFGFAWNMRVSQPDVSRIQKDPCNFLIRLENSTETAGGKLNIQVESPDGKNYKLLLQENLDREIEGDNESLISRSTANGPRATAPSTSKTEILFQKP